MQAREVLFPKLFPTQQLVLGSVIPVTNQTAATIQQQVAKLTPSAKDALLNALGRTLVGPTDAPKFANAAQLARRNDPTTSKTAAMALTLSGGRESAKAKVLAFLRNPSRVQYDYTAHEISNVNDKLLHPSVHKRLPDLRRDGLVENGLVRKCGVTGRPSLTWKAK